jgi:hypothetical protein
MPLMPTDITDQVRTVLLNAHTGKGTERTFLTAYQILERLPDTVRTTLISERQLGGKGTGVTYAAPSVVSDAAERIPGIEIAYLDTQGIKLEVAGQTLTAGYPVCGLYRLPGSQSS